MTGVARHALFVVAVVLAVLSGGCGPEGEGPSSANIGAGTVGPEVATDAHEAVDNVVLQSLDDLAAQAPLGRLRVAPDAGAGDMPSAMPVFRHLRGNGPDLVLTVSGPVADPIRWSASPGRLTAAAPDGALAVSVVAGRHDALYRFVVPPGEPLQVGLEWRGGDDGDLVLEGSLDPARGRRDVTGELRLAGGEALYLAARFDRAFDVVTPPGGNSGADATPDTHPRRELRLAPGEGVVHLRLALSSVDLAAARAALGEDDFDYAAQWASVRAAWNRLLDRVSVTGDADLVTAVATSLYRVLARYGNAAGPDGRYRAPDGAVRRMPAGAAYLVGYDLEREQGSVVPLLLLVAPEWMPGLAETLLARSRSAGLPVIRPETATAAADRSLAPALPVLAALVAADVPGVDAQRLFPPMLKSVTVPDDGLPWSEFQALGYFPHDRVDGRSVLLTLEASRAHRAVAEVAAALSDRPVAMEHATRTLFYRALFEPDIGRFCARSRRGAWRPECILPVDVGADSRDEGRRRGVAAQWAPARFDIDGLIALLGGRQALAQRLSRLLFEPAMQEGSGVDYDHADPAFHHVPWLYAFSNVPERTGPAVRRILENAGPVTAESVEQSAWRVFAILGFYPVLHGQGEYVLGEPLVREARLRSADRELRIERAAGEAGRTGGIELDGVPLPGRTVTHRRLLQARVLRYEGAEATAP